jgi:hypothetical protein
MTERDALMNQLAEIADYFTGCADNAEKGSNAEVHFMVLKNAAKIAREKLMDGNFVRVTRCADCRYWEPENDEEGDYSGHCKRSFGICYGQVTDASWFCEDGERDG